MQYTLIDEHLNVHLCHYFFGKKRDFIGLWKTKKFRNFNYHVLERLSLREKLDFLKSIAKTKTPKKIVHDIEEINALRNGLAHAFFPENLKRSRPIYKGKNIFAMEGIQRFVDDMGKISNFLASF